MRTKTTKNCYQLYFEQLAALKEEVKNTQLPLIERADKWLLLAQMQERDAHMRAICVREARDLINEYLQRKKDGIS